MNIECEHCWHLMEIIPQGNGNIYKQICCFCGKIKEEFVEYSINKYVFKPEEHGPYWQHKVWFQ